VKTDATIVIADRNPHVRGLLKRELAAAGFTVLTADSGKELLYWAFGPVPIDLLVVDPDLPDVEPECLLQKIAGRIPSCPLIIHAITGEERRSLEWIPHVTHVEKGGRSVEQLIEVITRLLTRPVAAASE
jgi:DNA-binding NtrC family response regulator